MSTLMSRDLNLTRPATRVRDPPGGRSSISFGDEYASPAPSPREQTAAKHLEAERLEYKSNSPGKRPIRKPSANRQASTINDCITQVEDDGSSSPSKRALRKGSITGGSSSIGDCITQVAPTEQTNSPGKTARRTVLGHEGSVKNLINPDDFAAQKARPPTGRQAPGGRSTIVIG